MGPISSLMRPKKVLTIATLTALVLFVYYAANAAPLISDSNYTYLSGMRWYKSYDEGAHAAPGRVTRTAA